MAKPAGEQKSNTMFGNARKSTIFIALGTMLLLDLAIGLSLG